MARELLSAEEDKPWLCYRNNDTLATDCLYYDVVHYENVQVPCNGLCLYVWEEASDVAQIVRLPVSEDLRGRPCTLTYQAHAILLETTTAATVTLEFSINILTVARNSMVGRLPGDTQTTAQSFRNELVIPDHVVGDILFNIQATSTTPFFRIYLDEISLQLAPTDGYTTNTGGDLGNSTTTGQPAQTSSTSNQQNKADEVPIIPIVAGVVGGALLLIVLLAFVLFWRRRNLRKAKAKAERMVQTYSPQPRPYSYLESGVTSYHSTSSPTSQPVPISPFMSSSPTSPPITLSPPMSPAPGVLPPSYVASTIPSASPLPSSSGTPLVDDDIGRFAASHRQFISPALEAKLRNAAYRPGDDPENLFTKEEWHNTYHVSDYDLRLLQEAAHRLNLESYPVDKKVFNHSAAASGYSWVSHHDPQTLHESNAESRVHI